MSETEAILLPCDFSSSAITLKFDKEEKARIVSSLHSDLEFLPDDWALVITKTNAGFKFETNEFASVIVDEELVEESSTAENVANFTKVALPLDLDDGSTISFYFVDTKFMRDSGLGPKYELTRYISRGGYSHVLGGTRASDGSPVALKISTSDGENSETEAEILSQLRHRNIVPLLDQGTAQGQTILVMQYYEGTLHSLIQKGFTGGDAQVKARLREIVSAVQYSHSNGIIHRDIKCSNILIGRDESWNVGDFGISRKGKGSTLFDTATWTMAPELRRDGLKTHNSSVDVWSLGIIAYQLLEGPGQPRGAVHSHTDLVFSSDRWKSNYGTLLKDFVKRAVLQDPTRRCVHNFVSRALEPSRPPRGNKKLIICSRPLA